MIPSAQPSDQQARERIRTSLDESLLVEASAGAGKTTVLVDRIVEVLRQGKATIQQIAAVTFTHKAAGELKWKLREELDKARHNSPAIEHALKHLEDASIGTIHSFCAQILRERPVEAEVDPAFVELNEQESDRLYQRAFRAWLEKQLAGDSPALRRAFARLAWRDSWDDSSPLEQLRWAGKKLVDWRDFDAAWHNDKSFLREEEVDTIIRLLRELAQLSSKPRRVTDNLYKHLAPVRALAGWIERAESAAASGKQHDYDALEAMILKLARDLRDLRKGSGVYGEVSREDLLAWREELMQWIGDFRKRADASLAASLREEMQDIIDLYEERKTRAGKLDFCDLLLKTRNLICGRPDVRQYLQNRFTHIFVDEFQDTDPLQSEILLLLAADDPAESDWMKATPKPGKLLLVGDPKQSIYKFRRADIEQYQTLRSRLKHSGVDCVQLTTSYRAVRNIQLCVNAAFETEMEIDYAPLNQHREDEQQPSVVVLPVPRPYKQRISKEAINQSLPDAIAAWIHWLLTETKREASPWKIHERDPDGQITKTRDITAGDIAILFRRRTQAGNDLTREYARALEARGVAHLLAGSKSFHHRDEVETLRVALQAIEFPDDELSVFSTLKGSLFAIPDELLLLYRHQHGNLHPFHVPGEEPDLADIREALRILADLHRSRNRQPFAATVNALLEITRAHAAFILRPGGNQILANVARVAELARGYELLGGTSFRGFVEELNTQAERDEGAEAPVLEEDSDGVRLMTVHGAKGLEFRCVILADVTANLAARDPDQFVHGDSKLNATRLLRCAPKELLDNEPRERERERAEGIRVAYVAATRARDLLVIPAVGDEAFDGWLAPLNKAIYPSRADWRHSQRDPRCPDFGPSSVVDRPLEYLREEEFSVRPGLVRPQQGAHEVVWWDPSKLTLNVDAAGSLRSAEVLRPDAGSSLAAYREWERARADTIDQGSAAEFLVMLASQAAADPPRLCEVAIERVERTISRPSGRRFGTLMHAVLRDIELDAPPEAIAELVELNARSLGASAQESGAAKHAIAATLMHPLMQRARKAERKHREYPVTLKLERNELLEGVIDLAFIEDGKWTIVDFKTDESQERREIYVRQLQWYAYALERLTGMAARTYLLEV